MSDGAALLYHVLITTLGINRAKFHEGVSLYESYSSEGSKNVMLVDGQNVNFAQNAASALQVRKLFDGSSNNKNKG